MSVATSLLKSLPKPKYTGEDEELVESKHRGPRVVGAGAIDESQVVVRRSGPPPYPNRTGWRPRSIDDFGDGGAFPEILHAQYPLDMGRKTATSSNALALQVDAAGKVKYDAIARRGHSDKRIIHSEFKDLIPLRQRADVGELSLERPSEEEVAATRERTQLALQALTDKAVAAQKPKSTVKGTTRAAPTYVSYQPDAQMGDQQPGKSRIIKIVDRQLDPLEPPKHKHKKIPRGPPSPPPPVMHSPPRKLTAEDQEAWRIPPPVSNWKNPKGYTVPLDKRLAADGRGLQDVTINDKFAQFSEALQTADRHAREEVKQRASMQQRLAEKEKQQKEEHLRSLAQTARAEAARARGGNARRYSSASGSRTPSPAANVRRGRGRSATPVSSHSRSRSVSEPSEPEDQKDREKLRKERKEEHERKLRQSRMGAERRVQALAREQNRDISEKVALGLAKPTASAETMYDSRLFNQTSGFAAGFNEDQAYDKPLFAAQDAIGSIYRPSALNDDDDDDGEDAGAAMDRIQKAGRFGDALGRAPDKEQGGFRGVKEAEARQGPVIFEKADDPFGIDAMINEAKGAAENKTGEKRYGLNEEGGRSAKRARVDDD